jgi:hypothetical protein
MTDETSPLEFENNRGVDTSHIKGWGIDADPENDPTYPIKNRTNEEHKGYSWERPPQQPQEVEILKSVERPNITAVFGTSTPPAGLSGMIRRQAYKYSESSLGRWVPLILADRIGVVEGVIDDIGKGIFPNIFKETGWTGEWKYDRQRAMNRIAIAAAITACVVTIIVTRRGVKFNLSFLVPILRKLI